MFYDISHVIMLCLLLAVFILGLVYRDRLLVFWRLVHLQITLALLVELSARITQLSGIMNTHLIYNLYILFEQTLLAYAAGIYLGRKKLSKAVIASCIAVWFWRVGINSINYFAIQAFLFGCVLLVCLYTLCIIKLSRYDEQTGAFPYSLFFSSVLIYFAGSIPLFGVFDFLSNPEHKAFGFKLYTINNVLAIARYALVLGSLGFATGLLKTKKTLQV